jgi:methylglutaconyl-CoA hydratase
MENCLTISTDERGVATVTLNRPDVHNAFSDALISELETAFTSLGSDETVRIIILTGAGKSFSAGADLNWMKNCAAYSEEENVADAMRLSSMLLSIYTCPKPTLAWVNGAAFGGGVGLAAACDIAVTTATNVFCLSEVRLGLTPATISPYVVRAIGERAAHRYFLTGERFDGIEARKIGLIHETGHTPQEANMIIDGLTEHLLAGGPAAQADCKKLISMVSGAPLNVELRTATAKQIAQRRVSSEGQEGLTSFLEKRSPAWKVE